MKTIRYQFITILFLLITSSIFSQRILIVEEPGTINNRKFAAGSYISIKTNEGLKLKGHINNITDSTIVVDYITINIRDIKYVITSRRLIQDFSALGTTGGLAYVSIDAFNGLINNDNPIFRKNTLKIGGIMYGCGLFLKLFEHKRLCIDNKKWRIKVLDFSILKDPGVYEQIKKSEGN